MSPAARVSLGEKVGPGDHHRTEVSPRKGSRLSCQDGRPAAKGVIVVVTTPIITMSSRVSRPLTCTGPCTQETSGPLSTGVVPTMEDPDRKTNEIPESHLEDLYSTCEYRKSRVREYASCLTCKKYTVRDPIHDSKSHLFSPSPGRKSLDEHPHL